MTIGTTAPRSGSLLCKQVMKQIMAMVLSAFALPLVAADIYVDAKNYGKSGLTGAAGSAFGTIQDAVNAASTTAMDTIHVAAGIYDKGDTTITGTRHARVKIDRRVKIVADEGKEKTFLVGSLDGDGIGGFYISNDGAGSIIEGFTVCNCQVGKDSAAQYVGGAFGGGSNVIADPTENSYTVAYCTMSNNVAYRGGAIGGGFAISCVIANNSLHLAAQYGSGGYRTSAYNCLVVDNRGCNAFYRPGYVVNSTFVNNYDERGTISDVTWADQGYGRYWNTVTIANCSANNDKNGIYTNCVMDGTSCSNISFGVTKLTHGKTSSSLYENTLMGSAIGDYRPVSGGLLDGTGVRDYLSLAFIPAEYRGRGFDGEPWTGDVPIGALIESVTPATAPLKVTNIMKIDGRTPACDRTVMYYATWPKQVYVTPSDTQTGTWLGISLSGYTLYKGQQDGVWVTVPPRTTEGGDELPTWAFGTRVADAENTFYVDDDADPTLADGTEAHPYVTIQDAMARLSQKVFAVVNVMPGTYRTGGGTCSYGHNARVVVPAYAYVLIRAVEGPANTIIEGQPDPDTGGPGPQAYRCISSPNNALLGVSGFTFTKGYSGFATEKSGGAFRGGGINQHCYDCVFIGNGDSSRDGGDGGGSCGDRGWFVRCVFSNNVESFRGTLANSTASSCLFAGNQPGPKAAEAVAGLSGGSFSSFSSCKLFSCTMYEPTEYGTQQYFYNPSDCDVVNCVMNDGGKVGRPAASHAACGNIAYGVASLDGSLTSQQVANVDPMIVKPERGDFRLAEGSPALTGGRLRNVTDDTTGSFEPINVTNFVRFTIGDLHNHRNVFADGSVLAGAISEVRPRETLYVDAENGNDTNGGYAENDAKRTFSGAFDELYSGDRMVVLPGVYDEGDMGPHVGAVVGSADPTIKSRVVVPANFTLESRDGAASTVIVGASATDAEESRGCGADAMRAVFLESGAKIKGFTIRDGRTAAGANIDDAYGAGVYGRGRTFSTVEDCVLAGNIGWHGAAGAYVSLVNCVVTNNVGLNYASGGMFCNAYNTFFADCVGTRVVDYPNQVVNCTFGPGNVTTNNSATPQIANLNGTNPRVLNALVYGTAPNSIALAGAEVRNCVFPSNMKPTVDPGTSSGLVTNFTSAALAEHFGDLGVPLSADAPTVDAGFDVSAFAEVGAADLAGTQRIYNGKIDIGCREYDMRGDFASKAGRGIAVSAATPGVTLGEGGLVLGAGDAIAFDWTSRFDVREGTYTVKYTIGEGSRLVITVNGAVHEVAAPGPGALTFKSALDSNLVVIRCESGAATVSGCIRVSGIMVFVL